MDGLHTAVLVSLDPTRDPNQRKQAFDYCQNIRSSPQGWSFVLESLSPNMPPTVAHWCLGVISETLDDPSRYPAAFSAEQVAAIRGKILEYFSVATFPERYANDAAVAHASAFPTYLLNKLCQVVVSLIGADYPHAWPSAFQETLLPLADSPQATSASTMMFFRMLRGLDDDITSVRATQISERRRQVSIRVKDAMRDDCIATIVAKCSDMITGSPFAPQAFDIIARYVEWVDINLIAQQKLLSPMYAAITSQAYCEPRGAAAAALSAIILKRMNAESKLELMNALKLEALLRSIPVRQICANVEEPGDPGLELQSGRVQVAALVNTVAGAALDILKEVLRGKTKFNNSAKTELEAGAIAQVALPVALGFLHEDDEDISAQILKCVSTYVNVFAQAAETDEEGSSKDGVSAMVAILKAVEDRAVLPRDFDPHEFERRHPFTEVRRMLIDNVFRSVARAFGDLCTEFLTSLFRKAWASGNELSIELAFALLVSFVAEGPISPDFEELQQMVIENPPKCMKFGTNVSATSIDKPQATHLHQLELVSKHYFALVGRSDRLFLRQEDNSLFRALLPVFFDERGLGHKCSMVVRSSAAHALLKFTKLLRYLLSKSHLRDMIIAAEAHMFPVGNPAYTQNDQMEVFESVGYLLGTDTKWEESLKCLTAILGKVLEGFQSNDPEVVIGYITAAGSLSKGFGGDSRPLLMLKETEPSYPPGGVRNDTAQSLAKMQPPSALALKVQEIWINCLEAAMKASKPALQIGTQHTELRARLVGFLHRMVDTIGAPVLPFIEDQVGQLVHTASTAVELHVTLSLISQIVTKFAGDAQSIALSTYAPLVRKVHEYSVVLDPTTLLAISEESREAADMHRAYTYFLHALVRTKLFTVLLFPEHLPLLGQVMSYVLSNAIGESLDSREAGPVMKMSLHMLGDLVKAWIGPQNDNSPPGFRQFALKECANAAMTSAVRGTVFRVGDTEGGEATSVLTEIASLQQTCASHLGQDFARAVQQGPWNTLPRENVNDYLSALYSGAPLPSLVPALATLSQQLRILSNR